MCGEDVPKGIVVSSSLYLKREDAIKLLAKLLLKICPEVREEDAIRIIAEKMTPEKYPRISEEAVKRLFAKTFDEENRKMMVGIKTIDKIPEGCNDGCICCHDGWCYAIHTGDGTGFDYQAAQMIRPYNCPLVLISDQEIPVMRTSVRGD